MTNSAKIYRLVQLQTDIDARVKVIRDAYPNWLCGKGCGGCCQRLAEIPQLTAAEWELLREALQALPRERLDAIRRDVANLAVQTSRPLVCPLLDQVTQSCPVYAQRPVACRTYGFYVQRDQGVYCREIEAQVAQGDLADVVWGNHAVIEQQQGELGESRSLTEWFTSWVHD